jgi:hypothetical protein
MKYVFIICGSTSSPDMINNIFNDETIDRNQTQWVFEQ